MASTRDTLGERETFELLVTRGRLETFEEDSAVSLCRGALYRNNIGNVVLPNVTSCAYDCLGDGKARTVDFGNDVSLPSMNSTLASNTMLEAAILRYPQVVGAIGIGTFKDSRIWLCEGALFVPDHLVDAYIGRLDGGARDGEGRASRMLSRNYVHVRPISAYPVSDYSTIRETWADIITSIGAGTYADRYFPGDTKLLELNDGTTLYMQLAAVDTDTLSSDPSSRAATTWICNGICPHQGKADEGRAHAWPDSSIREWLRDELLPLLPAVVRRNVKSVRKSYMTDYVYSSATGLYTQAYGQCDDTIWIPSCKEVHPENAETSESPDPSYYGQGYDYRVRRDPDMTVGPFWTRDSRTGGGYYIADGTFLSSGSVTSSFTSASETYNIVFGFCL